MVTLRICFVGDSFVNGTGDPTYLGWAGRICTNARRQGHDITYYNLGIRRNTSTDIKARWYAEVLQRLPAKTEGRIVFSFGVNDTTIEADETRVAYQDSIQNAHDILAMAQSYFPVLMVSPVPIEDEEQNQRSADLSQQFATVCQRLNVPYLDVFPALQTSDVWREEIVENDGAHPFADGYTELANLVEEWSAWQAWLSG